MQKLALLRDRLFKPNPNLTAIMNKARVYNTSIAIVELVSIMFFVAIPGRTNQLILVVLYSAQSFIAIIGEMYIQLQNKINNYKASIQLNLLVQVFLLVCMYLKLLKFQATNAACSLVNQYYDGVGGKAKISNLCNILYGIYALWTIVDIMLITLRAFSLLYMAKSYKFLQRKL